MVEHVLAQGVSGAMRVSGCIRGEVRNAAFTNAGCNLSMRYISAFGGTGFGDVKRSGVGHSIAPCGYGFCAASSSAVD